MNSELGKKLEQGALSIPQAISLDGCLDDLLPYFLVGDGIFPLKTYLMRLYLGSTLTEKKSVYNYQRSRACRVIENSFGILVSRWRIFNTPIHAKPKNVEKVVLAAMALHNYLRQTDNASYCPQGYIVSDRAAGDIVRGHWRNEVSASTNDGMANVPALRGSRRSEVALHMRDSLIEYTNSDLGSLSWQLDYICCT